MKIFLYLNKLIDSSKCLLDYHHWKYFKIKEKPCRTCLRCRQHERQETYHIKAWIQERQKMGRVYTDWRDTPDDPNRVGDEDYDPYPMPQREDEDEDGTDAHECWVKPERRMNHD